MFERVVRVAGDSTVPMEALRQRHAGGGRRWTGWLAREARFEARRLGLVSKQERFMPVAAVVSGALLALAVVPLVPSGAAWQAWACVAAFAWLPLFIVDAAMVDDDRQVRVRYWRRSRILSPLGRVDAAPGCSGPHRRCRCGLRSAGWPGALPHRASGSPCCSWPDRYVRALRHAPHGVRS
ncbi:hypothetical protein [Dactylosporangium sp. NPDC051541]|uniref:hypothetical protein n=1 Tax=Dactylosporangium sp. NPDC051541 TaxID=3363977 RepID=UPI0037B12B79